jgi:hypothetical protein
MIARRTDSAYGRFLASTKAWDVMVSPCGGTECDQSQLDQIVKLPPVREASILSQFWVPVRLASGRTLSFEGESCTYAKGMVFVVGSADAGVLILGAIVVVLVVVAAAADAAWLVTRARTRSARKRLRRDLISGPGRLPPAAACGVRAFLRPGVGPDAVPVRSSLVGIAVGIATLVGTLTFAAGFDHLLATPRLSGWNWDTAYGFVGSDPTTANVPAQFLDALHDMEQIEGVKRIGYVTTSGDEGPPLVADAPNVAMISFSTGPRAVVPTVVEGHAPQRSDEVVLTAGLRDIVGVPVAER